MTWGEAFIEAVSHRPMTPSETASAWFVHFEDFLTVLRRG